MEFVTSLFNMSDLESVIGSLRLEITTIIRDVKLVLDSSKGVRRHFSNQFNVLFDEAGWKRFTNLYFDEARSSTIHYIRNRVLVVVSWRHYEKIGTELLKFQTDFISENIIGGIYICVSERLVDFLKEYHQDEKEKENIGTSITKEKAEEYLKNVSRTITVPIAIMGLIP